LLHDAVEDQGGQDTLAVIRDRFGDRVAEIVEGCSDAFVRPKPPWRERKEHHIARMQAASPSVRLVTLADKLHNARTVLADYRLMGESLWKRFNGGREGTLWYYRSMIDVMRKFGPLPLLEELERVVSELEKLAGAKD
jgi:(p)ppGpp synthase/HD superfamily hydrolase